MNINKTIDHTYLKADAGEKEIKRTCQETLKYGFRSVCINPEWVSLAKKELKGKALVVTVIDWPCGAGLINTRVFEAKQAKKDGADEIDPVIKVGKFKEKKYTEVLADLKKLSKILPTKVIIETGFLSEKEIIKASKIVKKAGAICVKTSTGVSPKVEIDKKVKHIKLMRKAVGPKFLVKAAGGIRTLKDVEMALKAGADIIGTSGSISIVKEMKNN